ncbi:hypothetical protein AB0M12_28820 [Nocardia vinacea]|uniref:hypothetical protein n=1 Tax=Nocardia vinacea TaxID=96468 RepID=UPI00341E1C30
MIEPEGGSTSNADDIQYSGTNRADSEWSLVTNFEYLDEYWLPGVEEYQATIRTLPQNTGLRCELVPVIDNEDYPFAASVNIDGSPVGNLSKYSAGVWHHILYAMNETGYRVFTRCTVIDDGYTGDDGESIVGIRIALPNRGHMWTLESISGVTEGADNLWDSLPESSREHLIVNKSPAFRMVDYSDLLFSRRHLMPRLRWTSLIVDPDTDKNYIPKVLIDSLVGKSSTIRSQRREEQKRISRTLEVRKALALQLKGMTQRQISTEMGCSTSKVRALLKEALNTSG